MLSDLTQDRWQLISELSLDNALLSGINTRLGYTDYEHAEIEGGETGTVFKNETLQARIDLLLQEFSGWKGALSFEAKSTDFEAIGEEAFTPPSRAESCTSLMRAPALTPALIAKTYASVMRAVTHASSHVPKSCLVSRLRTVPNILWSRCRLRPPRTALWSNR